MLKMPSLSPAAIIRLVTPYHQPVEDSHDLSLGSEMVGFEAIHSMAVRRDQLQALYIAPVSA